MSSARWKLLPLVLAGAALAACQSTGTGGGPQIGLTLNGSTQPAPYGLPVTFKVTASNLSADESTSTPLTGTVTLSVALSDDMTAPGTLSVDSVPLEADGTATFTFTVCAACTATTAKITASLASKNVSTTFTLRLGTSLTPDAGTETTDGGGAVDPCSGATACSPSGYVLNVAVAQADGTASSLRLTAPASPLIVTATLSQHGTPVVGASLNFILSSSVGTLQPAGSDSGSSGSTNLDVMTAAAGLAKVRLVPQNVTAASGDLVVSFTEPGPGGDEIQVQRFIKIVVPGTLSFTPDPADNFVTVMGVKGSDFREQNILRFTLLDSSGQPYTGPAKVTFLLPGQTRANDGTVQGLGLGGAKLVPTEINTDSNGQAFTTLYSGTAAGTLTVNATATTTLANSVPLSVTSSTIAVVGAKANSRNFSMSCDYLAIPALIGNDCSFMRADMTLACTAVIGDRYNNVLGVSQQVTWLSEAGLFGPPSSTTAASPGADPTGQPTLGRTSNTLRTLNAPVPMNLDDQVAVSGEPTYTITNDVCSGATRQARPRDGLVTLIAITQGEEGFIDLNGNGQWDPGENFYDLGEPYIDANDNNEWDLGESFVDVNGNGQYDGANGTWDSNTTIWAVQHVAFTGLASQATWYFSNTGGAWASGTVPDFTGHSPSNVWSGNLLPFGVQWQDENGNEPAPQFASYAVEMGSPSSGSVTLTEPGDAHYIDQWGSMVVRQPTTCVASPVSGVCTVANPKCQCKLNTAIVFDEGRLMYGNYAAPTGTPTTALDVFSAQLTIDYNSSTGSSTTITQGVARGVIP